MVALAPVLVGEQESLVGLVLEEGELELLTVALAILLVPHHHKATTVALALVPILVPAAVVALMLLVVMVQTPAQEQETVALVEPVPLHPLAAAA